MHNADTVTPELSRDLALRIGLAARALPGITPAQLLEALLRESGLPLTGVGLQGLKGKTLKTALDAIVPDNEVSVTLCKEALGLLRGEEAVPTELPALDAYAEGDMPGSIRVACAANDADLDGHFGACLRFLIYQVSATEQRLIDIRATSGDREAEDRNAHRAELIDDCQVLVVRSIGGPAAARVVRAGIHPLKLPNGGGIDTVLGDLRRVLAGSPPPWLAKVMGASPEARVRFELTEDTP